MVFGNTFPNILSDSMTSEGGFVLFAYFQPPKQTSIWRTSFRTDIVDHHGDSEFDECRVQTCENAPKSARS